MKIGDRVKVTNLRSGAEGFDHLLGDYGTIVDAVGRPKYPKYHVRFDKQGFGTWSFFPDELELIKD